MQKNINLTLSSGLQVQHRSHNPFLCMVSRKAVSNLKIAGPVARRDARRQRSRSRACSSARSAAPSACVFLLVPTGTKSSALAIMNGRPREGALNAPEYITSPARSWLILIQICISFLIADIVLRL
ncbi:hypothetical protein Droror1_Dr00012832 [Drosera rotundifolia]